MAAGFLAALVGETVDTRHGMRRVEAHLTVDGAPLGHVFDQVPRPQGGLRYCINRASLRFVPRRASEAWVARSGAPAAVR